MRVLSAQENTLSSAILEVEACSHMSFSSLMGTLMTWVHTCLGGVLFSHPIGTSYCPSPPITF